jgi:hypothetical protein
MGLIFLLVILGFSIRAFVLSFLFAYVSDLSFAFEFLFLFVFILIVIIVPLDIFVAIIFLHWDLSSSSA